MKKFPLLAFIALIASTGLLQAQTWNLTGGGNWDDNGNWTPATYPDSASASVVINPSSGGTISNSGTDNSFSLNNLALGGVSNNSAVTISSASTLVFTDPAPFLNFINGTNAASARDVQAAIDATASGLSVRAGGATGSVDAVNTISGTITATGQTVSFTNSSVSGIVGQRIISVTGNITADNLNNARTASTVSLQGANTITSGTTLSGSNGTTLIRRVTGGTTPLAITPFGTSGVTLSNGHILGNQVTSFDNSIILANTVTIGDGGGRIDVGSSGDSFVLGDAVNDLTGSGALSVTTSSTSNPNGTSLDGVTFVLGYSNNYSGTLKLGSGAIRGFIDALASGATGSGALEFGENTAIRTSKTGGTVVLNNSSWAIIGSGGTNFIGGDSGSTTRLTGNFSSTGNSALNLGRNTAYGTSGGDQTIDIQGTGSLANNVASYGTTTVRLLLSSTSGTQTFSGSISNGTGAQALRIERNGTGGTTVLSGSNSYTGTTTVSAGVLSLSNGFAVGDTNVVTLSNTAGATLEVNSSETVGSLRGGGFSGGDVTIASGSTLTVAETNSQAFSGAVMGPGILAMSGTGTLTLSGSNTHSGGTIISNGQVTLSTNGSLRFVIGASGVNSAVTGNGTADLRGWFLFDLAGAATNIGATWTIVAGSVSHSYGTNFLVSGFNGAGGNWTNTTNGVSYVFAQSNSTLTVQSAGTNAYNSWVAYWQGAEPGFTNTAGTADPDGDSYANNGEFAFDGNPAVGSPALLQARKVGTNAVFTFAARADSLTNYHVVSTTNLAAGPWTTNSVTVTNSADQNGLLLTNYVRREFTVPASSREFFRVKGVVNP